MNYPDYRDDETEPAGGLSLPVMMLLLAIGGGFLYVTAGPPHLPATLPDWETIWIVLQGSKPPLEAFAYIFSTIAWIVWLWIVGSLVLRFIVVASETISRGALWARQLRAVSDRLTLPIVQIGRAAGR